MRQLHFIWIILVSLGVSSSMLHAQRNAKVPDPDPEIERKSFKVAEGFEVSLFAADPMLAKPIQMNFDPEGRLWVASSETYPHVLPKKKANDKILILHDTNHDGKADKTTVFADGLLIPTGLAPGDGGVYVANSTELVHLSDTTNDGKADKRRIVLSGFGTEDTHHLLHTLRWGPDGALYMNQSIYIHSHIETPHGPRRLNGGGIWRFRPETYDLSVFARGWVNAWGHHFDQWGQSFVTDGAGGEGINYVVPGASYPTAVGARRILHGLNPGSPKYCGAEIVSGSHLPESWQGNILTNDFRAHRVCRFVIKEDGSGFAAQQMPDVIKSAHPAFRPIDVKMGPDGAIYIADWYNPIIQHGEVDFRDPRRDHVHGRIWRVTAKGRKTVTVAKFRSLETAKLLDLLNAPEGWTREQTRRVVQERGKKEVLPVLKKWTAAIDRKKSTHEQSLLEALWMFQAIREVEPKLLEEVLRAKDGRIRAAGVRVLKEWFNDVNNPSDHLARLVRDEHPRVRMEAVRLLGSIPRSESLSIALFALDRPMDNFLDYALWLTCRELQPHWLAALQSGQSPLLKRGSHLTYALRAVGSPQVVKPLTKLIQLGKVPPAQESAVLQLIASQGAASDLSMIFDLLINPKTSDARRLTLMRGLAQAAESRNARPKSQLSKISTMLDSKKPQIQANAAKLLGLWKVNDSIEALIKLAQSKETVMISRKAALQALVHAQGKKAIPQLTKLAKSLEANARHHAVVSLAQVDLASAASNAVQILKSTQHEAIVTELTQAFLQERRGAMALANALNKAKLKADTARLALRIVRASGRQESKLTQALTQAGQLTAATRKLTPEQMKKWMNDVQNSGNPARGEDIFRRASLNCLKCHAIAGAGGRVGPDLISLGASAPVDYILDSLLEPNKAIKENYHSLVIDTVQGKVLTGIKIREANKELILRNAEDEEIRISTKDIDEQNPGASLMPEGLTDSLTRQELLDLTRFLSELGKPGPYQVGQSRVARRWRALTPSQEATYQLRRKGFGAVARPDSWQQWQPLYATVSGSLPKSDLPAVQAKLPFAKMLTPLAFLQTDLEVTTAGKVSLMVNDVQGLSLYLNGDPVEVKKAIALNLSSGRHKLTLMIRLDQRSKDVQLSLKNVSESKAQVRFATGK